MNDSTLFIKEQQILYRLYKGGDNDDDDLNLLYLTKTDMKTQQCLWISTFFNNNDNYDESWCISCLECSLVVLCNMTIHLVSFNTGATLSTIMIKDYINVTHHAMITMLDKERLLLNLEHTNCLYIISELYDAQLCKFTELYLHPRSYLVDCAFPCVLLRKLDYPHYFFIMNIETREYFNVDFSDFPYRKIEFLPQFATRWQLRYSENGYFSLFPQLFKTFLSFLYSFLDNNNETLQKIELALLKTQTI